jgi:hypothetical protein
MFVVALLTITKLWKQPKCSTINEWFRKCVIYTNFIQPQKDEILSFAGKWMEQKNIVLGELNQAQKAENVMFSLIWGL